MGESRWLWMAVALGAVLSTGCGFETRIRGGAPPQTTETPAPVIEPGALEGRVCSPSGLSWVGGAEVRVRDTARLTQTDATGRYVLTDLPAGPAALDITKGSFTTSVTVEVPAGDAVTVEPSCLGSDVSIAVVVGLYDNIENQLADLGLPFTLIEVEDTVDWLRDPESLSSYDMVFFNCGMRNDWVMYPEVVEHLRRYVESGGSVYASDEAYLVIEDPFPSAIEFHGNDASPVDVQRGLPGVYPAEVVDRDLQNALGTTSALIRYDLRNWTIATDARGGEPLLRATVLAAPATADGEPEEVPSVLAARARIGDGTVVFTSFHNQTQASPGQTQPTGDMLRILEDIILSL